MTNTEELLRAHKNVEVIDDERYIENGVIVTLVEGLAFEEDRDCGVRGFDSFSEALRSARRAVQRRWM